jgi:hypothetical protein
MKPQLPGKWLAAFATCILAAAPALAADAARQESPDATLLSSLIGLAGVVFGAIFTPLIASFLEKTELKRTKAEMQRLEAIHQELKQNFRDLADRELFKTTSRRLISFQLLVVDSYLRDRKSNRPPTLEILGINAIAPIHQGREMVRDILRPAQAGGHGGKVRILLLDPHSDAFQGAKGRMSFEGDTVGRLAAEMKAALCILADIRTQIGSAAFANLELRFHAQDPDRSLIMLDAGAASFEAHVTAEEISAAYGDGVILENPYSRRRGERGLEGESRRWTPKRGGGETDYQKCVEYFRQLWLSARPVNVPDAELDLGFVPRPGRPQASLLPPDASELAGAHP